MIFNNLSKANGASYVQSVKHSVFKNKNKTNVLQTNWKVE